MEITAKKIGRYLAYILTHIKSAICRKIVVIDNGQHNDVSIQSRRRRQSLRIVLNGSHNKIFIGSGCQFFGKDNKIFISGDGNKISIGDGTTFDQRVLLVACETTSLDIGNDCMFAAGATIRTSDQHPIYDKHGVRINPAKDIVINDHVWLGANCVVMKGIQIGGGTMVGYGSVVTRSLPENVVAAGTPARVLKENITWYRTFK